MTTHRNPKEWEFVENPRTLTLSNVLPSTSLCSNVLSSASPLFLLPFSTSNVDIQTAITLSVTFHWTVRLRGVMAINTLIKLSCVQKPVRLYVYDVNGCLLLTKHKEESNHLCLIYLFNKNNWMWQALVLGTKDMTVNNYIKKQFRFCWGNRNENTEMSYNDKR